MFAIINFISINITEKTIRKEKVTIPYGKGGELKNVSERNAMLSLKNDG